MAVSNTAWPRCTIWSSSGNTMNAGSVTMPPRTLEYMAWKLTALACTACRRRALASSEVKTGVDPTVDIGGPPLCAPRVCRHDPHCTPLRRGTQSRRVSCHTSERLQRLLHDVPHFGGRKGLTETRRSNLLEQPRSFGIERITGQ